VKVFFEDIDDSIDYIRVYSIFYKSMYAIPTISLVYEGEIVTSDFNIVDTGNNVVEVPIEEFNSIGGRLFTAEALASKNNYLFAANISEEYFDVVDIHGDPLDCRAYRFEAPASYVCDWPSQIRSYYGDSSTTNVNSGNILYIESFVFDINNFPSIFSNTVDDGINVLQGGDYCFSINLYIINQDLSGQIDIEGFIAYKEGSNYIHVGSHNWIGGAATGVPIALGTTDISITAVAGRTYFFGIKVNGAIGVDIVQLDNDNPFQATTRSYPAVTSSIYNVDGSEEIVIADDGSFSGDYSGVNWEIPSSFDSVNFTNDIYGKGNDIKGFLYKSDGITLGGTGSVISYEFVYGESRTISSGKEPYFTKEILINSTHKRREVYRYGIVFYDNKGRSSFAHWIGDILVLPYSTDPINKFFYQSTDGIALQSNPTYIKFIVDELQLPDDIKGFKIVVVEKNKEDKFVVASGAINSCHHAYSSGTDKFYVSSQPLLKSEIYNSEYNTFFSPDVTIGELDLNNDSGLIFEGTGWFYKPNIPIGTLDNVILYNKENFPIDATNSIRLGDNFELNTADVESVIVSSLQNKGTVGIPIENLPQYAFYNRARFVETGVLGFGPICAFLKLSVPLFNWFTPDDPVNDYVLVLGELVKNVFATMHGGLSYFSRLNNTYITASEYTSFKNDNEVFCNGDTFITAYEQMVHMWDPEEPNDDTTKMISWMFPVESKVNYDFVNNKPNPYVGSFYYGYSTMSIMEDQLEGITRWPLVYPEKLGDLYSYNNVYSLPPYGLHPKYSPKPLLFEADQTNHVMITASEKKTNGEYVDNWTKFGYTNFIEVDTAYGSLTELKSVDNKLFFWQEKGFGTAAVNDRSLVATDAGTQLSLGSGCVLERYDYFSNNVGVLEKYNVTNNENTLFWVYSPLEKIYIFDNQVKELSTTGAVNSYLHKEAPFTNPISIIDYTNHETLFRINDEVLVYSWLSGSFTGIYTYTPYWFIPEFEGNYLSSPDSDRFEVWRHNVIEDSIGDPIDRANFYGISNNSFIHTVFNKNYAATKVFDTINWFSTSLNLEDVNQYEDTFSNIRMYNDYQNTDWVELRMVDDIGDPTLKQNITRRERSFFHQISRDLVNMPQKNNVNIFDPNNLDATQLHKRRMRDKFLHVEMEYKNTSGNKFFFPYVNVNYRQSIR